MQSKVSPTLIGLFVLATLALGLGAIFFFSDGGLSHQSTRFILFFESDVKGLQVGSPVNFRGVRVGKVESMSITYYKESQEFRIPVIIGIDDARVGIDGVHTGSGVLIGLDELIKQGLRARLNLQSLVTGKLEIELDFHPNTPIRLVSTDSEYPEIPTVQSGIEKIASALEAVPIERITQRLTEILDNIEQMAASGELTRLKDSLIQIIYRLDSVTQQLHQVTPQLIDSSVNTLADAQQMMTEITETATQSQQLLAETEGRLAEAFTSWEQTMAGGEATFTQIGSVASSADRLLNQDSPLMNELSVTLRELGAAARSIRLMSEYLERHPEALLRGKQ
ncbi:MAG: MCE family protein [Candidatus Thiodiazotropha sp. (ex Ctena orbiculata)]|uniref:MCE family protein n=1 Tax=Candidatus Thiodiazotropha taylori TaxID=2792791 RepID=A0A944M9J7_9GAMM|nr:MCE family protein [Candidatus Thiodiazotropha taylori]MBT3027187.1 MCE family protein [Candidatus Thiodiazotropha taylori]MBT3034821.1 MCE family protein [Candidatus Thiodiazotropha taylori]MBV2137265.1 MCE family protein [Candidatus Thiodiazotropha taylori]